MFSKIIFCDQKEEKLFFFKIIVSPFWMYIFPLTRSIHYTGMALKIKTSARDSLPNQALPQKTGGLDQEEGGA